MRIGIYSAPLASQLSGIGRYVYELCVRLDALFPQATFFLYGPTPPRQALPSERWVIRRAGASARVLGGYGWLKLGSERIIRTDELNVFWATRTLLPKMPVSVGSVSSVYDLNHILVPGTMSIVNRGAHKLWFDADVRKSDQVVAISSGTALRLAQHLGRSADEIALPAAGEIFSRKSVPEIEIVLARLQVKPPYLLAVGTLEPRKNFALLVDAFLGLQSRGHLAEHTLVLVGASGWQTRSLAKSMDGPHSSIRALGFVSDSDLPALYSSAELFVMPSLYEGFGIPAAEASACGCRVLATDIPELREAAGPWARFVTANLPNLQEAILLSLSDPVPPPYRASSWDLSAQVLAKALRRADELACERR